MFSFHTSAFKSIKPQNWKVIGFTVISAIMLAIMTFASYVLLGLSTQGLEQQQMQAQLGGGSGNTASVSTIVSVGETTAWQLNAFISLEIVQI